jgi:hypothetical protein
MNCGTPLGPGFDGGTQSWVPALCRMKRSAQAILRNLATFNASNQQKVPWRALVDQPDEMLEGAWISCQTMMFRQCCCHRISPCRVMKRVLRLRAGATNVN